MIALNDPNREGATAMAMTALVAVRDMIVRLSAHDVDWAAPDRSDFVGVYLL